MPSGSSSFATAVGLGRTKKRIHRSSRSFQCHITIDGYPQPPQRYTPAAMEPVSTSPEPSAPNSNQDSFPHQPHVHPTRCGTELGVFLTPASFAEDASTDDRRLSS